MKKRKGIEISDETKRAVLMKNRKLSKKAFGGKEWNMYTLEFVSLVRDLFGYSENTIDQDIARSWERVYRKIKVFQ